MDFMADNENENKSTPLSCSDIADSLPSDINPPNEPQCYCNRPRNYNNPELQCGTCFRWFHHECLKFNIGPFHPFVTSYHFTCQICNSLEGIQEEKFARKNADFHMMCQTALGNLSVQNAGKTAFSMESDILPYLEKYWDLLASMPRKTNNSWHDAIRKILLKSEFFKGKESGSDVIVSLSNPDVSKIGPRYERFLALASQFNKPSGSSNSTGSQNKQKRKLQQQNSNSDLESLSGRESKLMRRANSGVLFSESLNSNSGGNSTVNQGGVGVNSGCGTGSGSLPGSMPLNSSQLTLGSGLGSLVTGIAGTAAANCRLRLNPCGFPMDYPFNKDSYRYQLVEPDPHAPGRRLWEETDSTAGKPIPAFFYRIYLHRGVLLSCNDRAAQLKLHPATQLAVIGEKGYCMVRATHGVSRGRWYFEVRILEQPEGSHARLGWAQALANLHTPCGYDKFGYSWRSRKGTVFHDSHGRHFSQAGYGKNDVVGCYIDLCDPLAPGSDRRQLKMERLLPRALKDKPLIKFKNHFYFEEKDDVSTAEKNLTPLIGSKIVFYRNGENIGTAFTDIYAGIYFPAVSLYRSIQVGVNFGPKFDFPPTDQTDWKPLCDRVDEMEVDQSLSDLLHLVDCEAAVRKMLSK